MVKGFRNDLEYLVIPGLYGSGPDHWQTVWEKLFGFSRLEQEDWDNPDFYKWQRVLLEHLEQCPSNSVVLIAHSLGCHLVVKSFRAIKQKIRGVFMVAPPNLSSGILQKDLREFMTNDPPIIDVPGCVVYSENDPYADAIYSESFGKSIGTQTINIGSYGHINSNSNLGSWDEGIKHFKSLLRDV